MTSGPRGARTAAAVLIGALLVAACSDADEPSARASSSTTAPPTTTTTSSTMTTTSGTEPTGEDPTTDPGGAAGLTGDLDGTAWVLTVIDRNGTPTEVPQSPVPAVVTFRGGALDVYDGVNTASGTYKSAGGDGVAIEMGRASTFPYTGDDLPQYDLIELLPRVESARRDGDQLVLSLDDGTELVLVPAAGGVTP